MKSAFGTLVFVLGAGLVFDHDSVPSQVARWGARDLSLQFHFGPSINNVGKDIHGAGRLPAHWITLRNHVTAYELLGSLTAFVPAM